MGGCFGGEDDVWFGLYDVVGLYEALGLVVGYGFEFGKVEWCGFVLWYWLVECACLVVVVVLVE